MERESNADLGQAGKDVPWETIRNHVNHVHIVLVNHGTASEWGGGDGVQISETARHLAQRGHSVSIQNNDRPDVADADLVHIFNCRVHNSFIQQMATCQAAGKPVVVSPIWISIGRALWGSRGTFGVLSKAVREGEHAARQDLDQLRQRQLVVSLDLGTLDATGQGTYNLQWQKQIASLLRKADGLLPNSWLELKACQTDLLWSGEHFAIAHYGVNPALFLDADPEPFRRHTGITGPFVLQAGRVEAGKNQAMLCWALRNTNLPIVLIGGTRHWPAYAELCKAISGNRLTLIDHLPQKLLASAYAAARVHCLASWMDTCGLVSLEAALSGTPLVGSTFGHELEYLQGDAWLADPGDPMSIRRAIEAAWEAGPHSARPLRLKQRILAEFNWERTTDATLKLYEDVLNS
jgi:glycosyltransferase involved in cell wall biosynthesis